MTERRKYDFERLDKYCKENNVTLLEDYSQSKLTRDIYIKTKCSYENCINDVNKKFRELEKAGPFCVNCIKIKASNMRKQSCLEKYGVENAAQNLKVREKMINTCLEKYGVKNTFQNNNVKNKIKETMIKRYGVENPNQSESIKNKSKSTNLEKYGFEYSSQNKENREKYKKTCFEKYGFENPSQNNEIKNKKIVTALKNWGVKYPIQNSEIFEKALDNSHKFKKYVLPSGKILKCQGYEPFAFRDLLKTDIDEANIINERKKLPEIWFFDKNNKEHRYYVDIYIPSQNKCIEVKSIYTYNKDKQINLLKQEAAKKLGYNFEFWIYDNKGNKIFYE